MTSTTASKAFSADDPQAIGTELKSLASPAQQVDNFETSLLQPATDLRTGIDAIRGLAPLFDTATVEQILDR